MTEEGFLVLADYQQMSKARKFFWVFKPREPIQWEPFDLHLTFRNELKQKFEGGSCRFLIKGELTHLDFELAIPPIESKETITVIQPNVVISEAGYVGITGLIIKPKNGKTLSCVDKYGINTATPERIYPLFLATREELYQKYAVIVALASSIIATILTAVNVLVSLLR